MTLTLPKTTEELWEVLLDSHTWSITCCYLEKEEYVLICSLLTLFKVNG